MNWEIWIGAYDEMGALSYTDYGSYIGDFPTTQGYINGLAIDEGVPFMAQIPTQAGFTCLYSGD